MLRPVLLLAVIGCQGDPPAASAAPVESIDVRVGDKVVAKVTPGHPCRATVDGIEVIVGGPPLVATVGDVKWTAETQANGTTFKKNDEPVARIHAKQLFDAQGIPLIKVTDAGAIVSGPGRKLRQATVVAGYAPKVQIKSLAGDAADIEVTHTEDVALAGLLSAPEADPTIRGLVACHFLQVAGS